MATAKTIAEVKGEASPRRRSSAAPKNAAAKVADGEAIKQTNVAQFAKLPDSELLKLRSVEFHTPPFRKLGGIQIEISERITLIAGRNGVGKSTILALIAGSSGMARTKFKTYLGIEPRVNAEEILRLSYTRDYVKTESDRPYVLLNYKLGDISFVKKGNVSGNEARLRVVPRNEPKETFIVQGVTIPESGKVPVPTIYLGMTRVIPTGETDPEFLQTSKVSMDPEDLRIYQEFSEAVIHPGVVQQDGTVIAQSISGTKKNSLYPNYSGYEATTVSLGQDSLSAIATALASFSKLRREMGNEYRGGLLVIDELDAGFHPRAQTELVDQLKSKARELQIQVVATTHSLTMLQYAHKDIFNDKRMGVPPDQIVYLKGGNPIELLDVTDFSAVYADMHMQLLHVKPEKKAVKVYVEDDEAALFLLAILTTARKKLILDATGYKLDIVPVHVGCANLVGLIKADDHFKSVVIAVDADANGVKGSNARNVVRLPVDPLNTKKQSPEVILREMCQKMVEDQAAYPATKKIIRSRGADESYLQQFILGRKQGEKPADKPIEEDREVAKAWFNNRLEHITGMKLIEGWVADNPAGMQQFMQDLTRAVIAATSDPLTLAVPLAGKKVNANRSSVQKVAVAQKAQSV
jgi:predicted ATPase